jgi:peptide/nickel transport system permease protein
MSSSIVELAIPVSVEPRRSGPLMLLRRIGRTRLGYVALGMIVLLFVVAAFAPQIAPSNPNRVDPTLRLRPPSQAHPFGTDTAGRDMLSRVIYGTRVAVSVGLSAVALGLAIGGIVGMVSGYLGGWVDTVIMRVVEAFIAIPNLALIMILGIILGQSPGTIVVAIGVTFTPGFLRMFRGQTLVWREREFIVAARTVGVPGWRIAVFHLLPNIVAPIIVQASLAVGAAILAESSLSFLGLGIKPPTPTWGTMVRQGYAYLQVHPWFALIPGACVFLTVLAFNFLGDAIRDALDPRLRNR